MISFSYSHGAIIGDRSTQEDAVQIFEVECDGRQASVLVVADGLGGHASGEVASQLALKAFAETAKERLRGTNASANDIEEALQSGLSSANQAVADAIRDDSSLQGMGTTLVAAVVVGQKVSWISVGDSLLQVVRDHNVIRLNADHSIGAGLDAKAELGEISWEEARSNPHRNALLCAISGEKIDHIDLQIDQFFLSPGDTLLAASDGLLTLDHSAITNVLTSNRDVPEHLALKLLEAVVQAKAPNQDNTTVAMLTLPLTAGTAKAAHGKDLSVALLTFGGVTILALAAWAIWSGSKQGARDPSFRSAADNGLQDRRIRPRYEQFNAPHHHYNYMRRYRLDRYHGRRRAREFRR